MAKDHCPWCFNRVRYLGKPSCWYCDEHDTYWVDGTTQKPAHTWGEALGIAEYYGKRLNGAWGDMADRTADWLYGVPVADPEVPKRRKAMVDAHERWVKDGSSCNTTYATYADGFDEGMRYAFRWLKEVTP